MKALGALALAVSLAACGYATAPAGELAGSQDRVAQSSLRNGIAAAKVCFTGSETYTGCTDAALSAIEPSLTFNVSPSTVPKQVDSVVYQTNLAGDSWAAAAMSDSGTCWWINDVSTNPGAGTFYGSTTTAANCTGDKGQGRCGGRVVRTVGKNPYRPRLTAFHGRIHNGPIPMVTAPTSTFCWRCSSHRRRRHPSRSWWNSA
jgi:hypothetical protein